MKKLVLRVGEIAVESFSVLEREGRGGTMHAHVAGARFGDSGMTQCATGPCDCMITDPYSCDLCTDQYPC